MSYFQWITAVNQCHCYCLQFLQRWHADDQPLQQLCDEYDPQAQGPQVETRHGEETTCGAQGVTQGVTQELSGLLQGGQISVTLEYVTHNTFVPCGFEMFHIDINYHIFIELKYFH